MSFLGYTIDSTGIQPDPHKTEAILKFRQPENVTEVRRFLGMANQMSKFIPNLAETTQPLRELLIKGGHWVCMGRASKKSFFRSEDATNQQSSSHIVRPKSTNDCISRRIVLWSWCSAPSAAEDRRTNSCCIHL